VLVRSLDNQNTTWRKLSCSDTDLGPNGKDTARLRFRSWLGVMPA